MVEELTFTACSADGSLLAAADNERIGWWISKDRDPWTSTIFTIHPGDDYIGPVASLAISADETKLLAVPNWYSNIYSPRPHDWISTNSGENWAMTTAPTGFTEIACSADGRVSVAAVYQTNKPGGIYISTNSWATSFITNFTGTDGEFWVALASLAKEGQLKAGSIDGGVYLTMSTGTAWTLVPAPNENWPAALCNCNPRCRWRLPPP